MTATSTNAVFSLTDSARYALFSLISSGTNQSTYLEFKPTGTGKAVIQVNGNDRLAIDSSGNMGIGTSTPSANLHVAGNAQTVTTLFYGSTSSNASYPTIMRDSSGNNKFYVRSDGLIAMPDVYSVWTTGSAANVYIDGSGYLYRSTSSRKYKRDITDYTRGLADVLKLRPKFYKGKHENDGETQFAGLIAEDVAEVGLDEFVVKAADGSPDALSYGNMVTLAFKAIQELNANLVAEIQELRKRMAAVEGK